MSLGDKAVEDMIEAYHEQSDCPGVCELCMPQISLWYKLMYRWRMWRHRKDKMLTKVFSIYDGRF